MKFTTKAQKGPAGHRREASTAVINAALVRDDKGGQKNKLMVNENHPMFVEELKKIDEKSKTDASDGVIYEVAKTMCGGDEGLQAALRRGAVQKVMVKDNELYFFPKTKITQSEYIQNHQTMSRSKDTTASAHKAISDMVSNVTWGFAGSGHSPAPAIADNTAEKKQLAKELSKVWADIQKGLQGAGKVLDRASKVPVDKRSQVFQDTLETVQSSFEEATLTYNEVGFAVKFNKMPHGDPMTVMSAQALTTEAVSKLTHLVEVGKQLRGVLPASAQKV
jgi:hypothetical protein